MVKIDPPKIFPFDGDWPAYIKELYDIYIKEIGNGKINFNGVRIQCRNVPYTDGKGYGFWHIIQEGVIEEERTPNLRRCERIRWIPWVIKNATTNSYISIWEEPRGTETDIMLWLEKEDYIVILAKRNNYLLLRSAYCTDRPHKKESLRKNRDAYWRGKKN